MKFLPCFLIVRTEDSRDRLSINWNVEDEKPLRTNVNMKSQGTMQAAIYKTEMQPLWNANCSCLEKFGLRHSRYNVIMNEHL